MAEETSHLESIDLRTSKKRGVAVVDIPIGTEGYVPERAMKAVKDGSADRPERFLDHMPDKEVAALTTIDLLGSRTCYVEKALGTELPLEICRRADNGAKWPYHTTLELPGAAEALSFGILKPHQKV